MDIPAAQQRIAELMHVEGLPYGPRSMTYNSRLAQELGAWSETKSIDEAGRMHQAIFEAYFVHNRNIAQIDVLTDVAAHIGFDQKEVSQVLAERKFQSAVDADWRRSRQLGITGVPAFVIDLSNRSQSEESDVRGLAGAQPYEQLAALLSSCGVPKRDAM